VDKAAIKPAIYEHPEFVTFIRTMNALFAKWRKRTAATLKGLKTGCHPRQVIADLSENRNNQRSCYLQQGPVEAEDSTTHQIRIPAP